MGHLDDRIRVTSECVFLFLIFTMANQKSYALQNRIKRRIHHFFPQKSPVISSSHNHSLISLSHVKNQITSPHKENEIATMTSMRLSNNGRGDLRWDIWWVCGLIWLFLTTFSQIAETSNSILLHCVKNWKFSLASMHLRCNMVSSKILLFTEMYTFKINHG